MSKYILIHDLTPAGDIVSLYDREGNAVNKASASYETIHLQEGWAEQDPERWWSAVIDGTKAVMQGYSADDIAAITFSSQSQGCLLVDIDGAPLMNSIIYTDGRSEKECRALREAFGDVNILQSIGQRLSANFTLAKLMWVRDNMPDVYRKAYKAIQAKDFISMRMTGRVCTDRTDAAMYQAYDVKNEKWCLPLIEAAGVSPDLFPEVLDSTETVGVLSGEAAAVLGLKGGTPVIAGASDSVTSSLGSGAVRAGIAFVYMGGTVGFAAVTDAFAPDPEGRLTMGPHAVKGTFGMGGPMNGVVSYEWLNKSLFDGRLTYEELDKLAESVPAGANGVMFLPYLQGERAPWWNAAARGAFIGLGMDTTRAELARAVMEGVVYNMELIRRIIVQFSSIDTVIVTGEGVQSKLWVQMIADVLGVTILRPTVFRDGNSFGAALVGGVGIGWYNDYTVALDMIGLGEDGIRPNPERHAFYQKKADVFEKAYGAIQPLIDEMNN